MKKIGKRIKDRRVELGLSAEDLAEVLGLSPSTIYRYESNGIMNMGIDKIQPIANALCTSASYLMGWTENKEPAPIVEVVLSSSESELLDLYRQLNEGGQGKVAEYVGDLVASGRYALDKPPVISKDFADNVMKLYDVPALSAAHEREDIEVTDEMRKADDDIMDDEDF